MLVSATINEARDFAVAKHGGQVRKHDGRPYIVHLDGVASVLNEHGYRSEEILSAAFLHDTIEKSDTTYDELSDKFGETVAELVYWLTDSEKGSSRSRAIQSAWRLSRAPWDAKLIKLADIIDNGIAIVTHNPEFGPTFLDEKRLCLKKMAEVETSKLLRLPLFQKAATVTESASL